MINEHLFLLRFLLKLQSGWSALIALLLVLALEGTHFFWLVCCFKEYTMYLSPIECYWLLPAQQFRNNYFILGCSKKIVFTSFSAFV